MGSFSCFCPLTACLLATAAIPPACFSSLGLLQQDWKQMEGTSTHPELPGNHGLDFYLHFVLQKSKAGECL